MIRRRAANSTCSWRTALPRASTPRTAGCACGPALGTLRSSCRDRSSIARDKILDSRTPRQSASDRSLEERQGKKSFPDLKPRGWSVVSALAGCAGRAGAGSLSGHWSIPPTLVPVRFADCAHVLAARLRCASLMAGVQRQSGFPRGHGWPAPLTGTMRRGAPTAASGPAAPSFPGRWYRRPSVDDRDQICLAAGAAAATLEMGPLLDRKRHVVDVAVNLR